MADPTVPTDGDVPPSGLTIETAATKQNPKHSNYQQTRQRHPGKRAQGNCPRLRLRKAHGTAPAQSPWGGGRDFLLVSWTRGLGGTSREKCKFSRELIQKTLAPIRGRAEWVLGSLCGKEGAAPEIWASGALSTAAISRARSEERGKGKRPSGNAKQRWMSGAKETWALGGTLSSPEP
jgi:hypothetical protein